MKKILAVLIALMLTALCCFAALLLWQKERLTFQVIHWKNC